MTQRKPLLFFVVSAALAATALVSPAQNPATLLYTNTADWDWNNPANWSACQKSYDRYLAYLVLNKEADEKGPGFIFSDFTPGNSDQTLTLADEKFNLTPKFGYSKDAASWVAVLTNSNYKPFFVRRFPQGKAYYVSKGEDPPNGGRMLWVMPPEKTKFS